MKRLLLVMGIVGCSGGDEAPPAGETALPGESQTVSTRVVKEVNNTDWIFEALAVRLGENELDHKQIVNTFGPVMTEKVRFLCRWLEKGKSIEMVGEMRQSTAQGDQIQRMYMVCRYDAETNVFVQTMNVDGKS